MAKPYVGQRIRIKKTSELFAGQKAVIAYIGDDGVSVYLRDSDFDDCIPLKDSEWEPDEEDDRG